MRPAGRGGERLRRPRRRHQHGDGLEPDDGVGHRGPRLGHGAALGPKVRAERGVRHPGAGVWPPLGRHGEPKPRRGPARCGHRHAKRSHSLRSDVVCIRYQVPKRRRMLSGARLKRSSCAAQATRGLLNPSHPGTSDARGFGQAFGVLRPAGPGAHTALGPASAGGGPEEQSRRAMSKQSIHWAAAAVVPLALLVGACGGSGARTPARPRPPPPRPLRPPAPPSRRPPRSRRRRRSPSSPSFAPGRHAEGGVGQEIISVQRVRRPQPARRLLRGRRRRPRRPEPGGVVERRDGRPPC